MSCVGEPLLVVQITETIQTTFGAVDFSVTGLDGPPVGGGPSTTCAAYSVLERDS
jgi:hypothetical protein